MKIDLGDESYIADVGFGGLTLTAPLRFVTDVEQPTPHERFRIARLGEDFKLQALIGETWKTLYRFDLQPQFDVDYELANHYMATHPASHFRSSLIAARPFPGGRYALLNNQLTIHHIDASSERRVLTSVEEVRDVLESMFGLRLPAAPELDPAVARVCGFSG